MDLMSKCPTLQAYQRCLVYDMVYFLPRSYWYIVQNAPHIGFYMAEMIKCHADTNPWNNLKFTPAFYITGWMWTSAIAGPQTIQRRSD